MTESGNPILSQARFQTEQTGIATLPMTMRGTMMKTGLLFLLLLAGASWTWAGAGWAGAPDLDWRIIVGVIGGLILVLVTAFNPLLARYTSPVYAFLEGMALGGISSLLEYRYPGIVLQAVFLTVGVFAAMWFLYASGIIKVTARMWRAVMGATFGVVLFYVASWVMSMFGVGIPALHSGGMIGIGISLLIVGIAAFNLLLDFDFIHQMSEQKASAEFEWYGAFGLMVTLVWLYVELLRLLSRVRK